MSFPLRRLNSVERQTSDDRQDYSSRYGSTRTPDSGFDSRAGAPTRADYDDSSRFSSAYQQTRASTRSFRDDPVSSPPPPPLSGRSLRTTSRAEDYDRSEGFAPPAMTREQQISISADDDFRLQERPSLRTPPYQKKFTPENGAQVHASSQLATATVTSNNPRVCTIDINIAINVGRGTPPVVTARDGSTPVPVHTTTNVIDNVRNIDIDFRLPKHTARISTDGIERSPRNQ